MSERITDKCMDLSKIDKEKIRELASQSCTVAEIATEVGCAETTILHKFAGPLRMGRAQCSMRLRKKQYELALAGNNTMLVWLGKQLLGQRDQQQIEHGGSIGQSHTIKVEFSNDWFGRPRQSDNAAPAIGAPDSDPLVTGPAQDSGVRQEMGEDGSGTDCSS